MLPLSIASSPSGSAGYVYAPSAGDRPRNVAFGASAEIWATVFWIALLVAVGVAIGLTQVRNRAHIRELRGDTLATRQILQRLELEESSLLAQAARLSSDDRIERVARIRLGMTRPTKGQHSVLP